MKTGKTAIAGAIFAAMVGTSINASGVASGHDTPWGYAGQQGPEHWGELGYPECSAGKRQSPVDIPETVGTTQGGVAFHYQPSAIDVINNGHTVQFNGQSDSYITLGDTRYDLLQFHFHSPSEHTISGRPFPMELQLVHQSADGQQAIVGVFIEAGQGSDNETLNRVFGALAGYTGQKLSSDAQIKASELLPQERGHYRFMGSLTTPPCSEGVKWFVMREPIEISARQLTRFQSIFDNNARPTQLWNKREFLH